MVILGHAGLASQRPLREREYMIIEPQPRVVQHHPERFGTTPQREIMQHPTHWLGHMIGAVWLLEHVPLVGVWRTIAVSLEHIPIADFYKF